MTESQIRYLNASNLLVILTGVALWYFKNSVHVGDPYSNLGNPFELLSHDAHIGVAPLLVFGIGLIWSKHVWPRFLQLSLPRMGIQKALSGFFLFVTTFPMILSAGLIQITVDEKWRSLWIQIHLGASLIWSVSTVLHLLRGKAR